MDRRYYGRVRIRVEGNFIVAENIPENREFSGLIENISEGGILIRTSKDECGHIADRLKVGMKISFQAYDEYELMGSHMMDIFSGEVAVLRVEEADDDFLLGCRFTQLNPKLEKYIQNKKLVLYTKSMRY